MKLIYSGLLIFNVRAYMMVLVVGVTFKFFIKNQTKESEREKHSTQESDLKLELENIKNFDSD